MKLQALIKRRKYGVSFGATDGALGNGWQFTNTAWTVTGGKAIATPTLGAEKFTNGSFAADANWTKGTGWTITAGGVGNHTGATASNITQAVGSTTGWYRVGLDIAAISGGTGVQILYGGSTYNAYTATQTGIVAAQRSSATTNLGLRAQANTVCDVDNATAKQITLSDMFAWKEYSKTTATISATVTNTVDNCAGVVGWLNGAAPTDFLIAYYMRSTSASFRIDKCVGGVYTNIAQGNPAYIAGGAIKLVGVRSGADLLVSGFYNGSQVGTTQTVSDAGIVGNTKYGMFSASELSSIGGFSFAG